MTPVSRSVLFFIYTDISHSPKFAKYASLKFCSNSYILIQPFAYVRENTFFFNAVTCLMEAGVEPSYGVV
jgi:hypothetical protein